LFLVCLGDARKDTPETAEADPETAEADQLTLRFSTPDHASHELMMKAKVPTVDVPTYISGRNGKIIRWQKPQGYVSMERLQQMQSTIKLHSYIGLYYCETPAGVSASLPRWPLLSQ
jgi:hypothetical protein